MKTQPTYNPIRYSKPLETRVGVVRGTRGEGKTERQGDGARDEGRRRVAVRPLLRGLTDMFKVTGRWGEVEKWRNGDKETRRRGEGRGARDEAESPSERFFAV